MSAGGSCEAQLVERLPDCIITSRRPRTEVSPNVFSFGGEIRWKPAEAKLNDASLMSIWGAWVSHHVLKEMTSVSKRRFQLRFVEQM